MLIIAGICIIIAGILQILVPLGIVSANTITVGGIPGSLFLLFFSSLLALLGIALIYHFWFADFAARMDKSLRNSQDS